MLDPNFTFHLTSRMSRKGEAFVVDPKAENTSLNQVQQQLTLMNQPLTFFQGNIWQQILSFHFILELVTTVPFTFTVSLIYHVYTISGWCLLYNISPFFRYSFHPYGISSFLFFLIAGWQSTHQKICLYVQLTNLIGYF